MTISADITADAIALQERDEFRAAGWLKVVAPAKVNLHLAIGALRPDGYHEAISIMHALALHDVVYLRRAPGSGADAASAASGEGGADAAGAQSASGPTCTMVSCGDVEAPDVAPEDNLAVKAVRALARACTRPPADEAIEIRIEKNIPAQGGLGGGSTDAAAVLVGVARLWGIDAHDPRVEQVARSLGADVAFFLHGGCAAFAGAGDEFTHALAPSRQAIALVKPASGVSTAEAYRAFDAAPAEVPASIADEAARAQRAADLRLFNNLAPAAENLNAELADVRAWLSAQDGVEAALLSGSGSATFAPCASFSVAARVVAAARKRGWWARATSFAPLGAMVVSEGGAIA